MNAYDLHTHTVCSDGTLTPAELLARAHACGVHALAVTDHDATDGLAEAGAAAARWGVVFVPGVEVSVTWQRQTVHIVGLQIDARDPVLQRGLARLREFRLWRAEEIGRRLRKKNIVDAYERARELARGAVVSRTHFARFLVARGFVASMNQAFKQYLGRGRVAHVPGQWAGLDEAVGWIRGAGGIAVVAHPARYPFTAGKLRRLLHEFKECGGQAVEVLSGTHNAAESVRIGRLAVELALLGSAGSDYHGPDNPRVELGRLPAMADDVTPVWTVFGTAPAAV